MNPLDQSVLLVIADAPLKQQYLSELVVRRPRQRGSNPRGHYQVSIAATLEEALHRLAHGARAGGNQPMTAVVDQSAFTPADWNLQAESRFLHELAKHGQVILTLEPDRMTGINGLAHLISGGRLEIVARGGASVSLVMALLERHASAVPDVAPDEAAWHSFGEILRHEMNNPLTGILGNAELLLARRDRLPPADIERLTIIADMAVRLRETVRRLSNSWEEHSARPREVEVKS